MLLHRPKYRYLIYLRCDSAAVSRCLTGPRVPSSCMVVSLSLDMVFRVVAGAVLCLPRLLAQIFHILPQVSTHNNRTIVNSFVLDNNKKAMVNFYLNFKGPFCLWNRKRTLFHNLTHAWIVLTRTIIVLIITLELSIYSQNRERVVCWVQNFRFTFL